MPRNVCQSLQHWLPELIKPYAGQAVLYSVLFFIEATCFQGAFLMEVMLMFYEDL